MWILIGIGIAFVLIKSGLAWVVALIGIGVFLGVRIGRVWGFRQLGAYEHAERMRRARSRQGGWGLF